MTTRRERIEALHNAGMKLLADISAFNEACMTPTPWPEGERRHSNLLRRIRTFSKKQDDLLKELFANVPTC